MNKTILKKLVKGEAIKLRANATESELKNLDIDTVDGYNTNNCIYGQMTGHCDSLRAIELMHESCERVYHTNGNFMDSTLNGSPANLHRREFWSPIELFLTVETKLLEKQKKRSRKGTTNIDKLVAFLKGERKTLIFK